VLDWFHLAMGIQHVAQAAKNWPDATEADCHAGARLAETIERIRWRLWHGQVRRALDPIDETIVIVDVSADNMSPITASASKATRLLSDLQTYVSGQFNIIIDYATARRCDEPISTAITESTVQWLLHRRMIAQMRWSSRGAHLMLKVRASVTNGTLDRVTTDGHDSYLHAIRTTLGAGVPHRGSQYLTTGARSSWCQRPIRANARVQIPQSTGEFCRAYDELRNFLRSRSRTNQPVSADHRRFHVLRRTATVLSMLEAA
jgi:hypothetical protein